MYDYDKLLNTTFDLNSPEIDSKNVFYKIFPMIEADEKILAFKKIIENEILTYKDNNNMKIIQITNHWKKLIMRCVI